MTKARKSKKTRKIRRSEADGSSSALQKAFAILEALVESRAPASLADLASDLASPKTSVQRILAQLEQNALIVRDETGKRYRLGGRLNSFAFAALAASARFSRAHLILRDLVNQIGESCNLGVLQGRDVVYIDRVECPWPLRTQVTVGTRAPIHCTGIGKLLLAHLPEQERDRLIDNLNLEKRTERTITNTGALRRELDRIRADGISINDQENMVGMIAIAAPVRDSDGNVVAGVAFEVPVPRMDLEQAKTVIPKLRIAASEISVAMTGRKNIQREMLKRK